MNFGKTYRRIIFDATGARTSDLPLIENIMRNEIFHSTLDWQSYRELTVAAREAFSILNEDREFYEMSHVRALVAFQQIRATPNQQK